MFLEKADAARDAETFDLEMILADLELVERRLERAKKNAKSGEKKYKRECEMCAALIEHLTDGKPARTFASQGQTRTAALAMKLAEREIYKNATGEYPILLLDDVLSELDPKRQEFVLNRIAGGQVFITCCEDDRLPEMLGGKVLHVKNGAVQSEV